MVSELLLEAVAPLAVMYEIPPQLMLYLIVFVIAVGVGLAMGTRVHNPYAGLVAFMGTLLIFSFLGAFPLWIIAIPTIITLLVFYYMKEHRS